MDKALLGSSLSSLFARGTLFLSQILVTALLARSYDFESLGIAAIIANFAYFMGVFDLGIGGAPLRNHLASMEAKGGDPIDAQILFFSLFQVSFALHLCLILLLFLPLDWAYLLSLKVNVGYLLTGALFLLLLRAPFLVAQSAFFAYHMVPMKALFEVLEALALLLSAALSPPFLFLSFPLSFFFC